MKQVLLVFTVHNACGNANASVLLEFLERYQPEVIFVELPRYAVDGHYGLFYTQSNLESIAVRQYRKNRQERDAFQVTVEPVDLPIPEYNESDYKELFAWIAKVSLHDRHLKDEDSRNVANDGFFYVNSDRCSQLWAEIYKEWTATVRTINDPELSARLSSWIDIHERRDRAMIHNIRQYCREHAVERGVFLVGAAHRQSIIDKSKATDDDAQDGIEWRWQE